MPRTKKSPVKIQPYVWSLSEKKEDPTLKIPQSMESVVSRPIQISNLVKALIKVELMNRNAYQRWSYYLDQAGLHLKGLVVYLEILHDDEDLVAKLKNYCKKISRNNLNDLDIIRREHNELKELLHQKIKNLSFDFKLYKVTN